MATQTPLDTGFLPFADSSMVRRVHREGVLLLGGGRALLMQIAHPMVAKGVAEHSSFRDDRWGRLLRTLRPTLAIVFGDREQALRAAAGINRMHERVRGDGYAALDPELLLWVHATLVDTSLFMHERFMRLLSPAETAAYYQDMCLFGMLLGIPEHAMPPDAASLRAYTAAMAESLTVSPQAIDIAEALFTANLMTWPVFGPTRLLTAGLLPEALRRQYGLTWSGNHQRAFDVLHAASRGVLPRLPRRLRAPPWFLMPG